MLRVLNSSQQLSVPKLTEIDLARVLRRYPVQCFVKVLKAVPSCLIKDLLVCVDIVIVKTLHNILIEHYNGLGGPNNVNVPVHVEILIMIESSLSVLHKQWQSRRCK